MCYCASGAACNYHHAGNTTWRSNRSQHILPIPTCSTLINVLCQSLTLSLTSHCAMLLILRVLFHIIPYTTVSAAHNHTTSLYIITCHFNLSLTAQKVLNSPLQTLNSSGNCSYFLFVCFIFENSHFNLYLHLPPRYFVFVRQQHLNLCLWRSMHYYFVPYQNHW